MNCNMCNSVLPDLHPDGREQHHKISGKEVCDDCYFDKLGELVEYDPHDMWRPRKS